jgi:hypothetical protein
LWQAELGYGLNNHSEFNEAPEKEKRARRRVFNGFLAEQAGFEPAVGY